MGNNWVDLGVVVHKYLPSSLWVFHKRGMRERSGEEKGWSDEAKTETWTWGEEFDFEVWMRGWRNSRLNYWLTLLLDWRHRLRLPKARVSPWDTPYISIFSPSVPFFAQTTSKPIHQAPTHPPKGHFWQVAFISRAHTISKQSNTS